MCGIAGIFGKRGVRQTDADGMANEIRPRGPDNGGTWVEYNEGIALAHRRLSILDTSAAGAQPMLSPCRGYVVVYNGEIYNHNELRAEIEQFGGNYSWRGHSDTETLLAGMTHWGIERCLKKTQWHVRVRTLGSRPKAANTCT